MPVPVSDRGLSLPAIDFSSQSSGAVAVMQKRLDVHIHMGSGYFEVHSVLTPIKNTKRGG